MLPILRKLSQASANELRTQLRAPVAGPCVSTSNFGGHNTVGAKVCYPSEQTPSIVFACNTQNVPNLLLLCPDDTLRELNLSETQFSLPQMGAEIFGLIQSVEFEINAGGFLGITYAQIQTNDSDHATVQLLRSRDSLCSAPIILYFIPGVPPIPRFGCESTARCQNQGHTCRLKFDEGASTLYCNCEE